MTPLTSDELAELERLAALLAPMLPVRVYFVRTNLIVTNQAHPFLEVSDPFHRQVAGGSGGDAADLVTALNALPRLIAELRELREASSGAPGTPLGRLSYLLDELERLFPDAHRRVMSDPGEPKYIAAIDALLASEARRREGLEECALVFSDYEHLHLSKEPPDMAKAQRNSAMAKRCKAALSRPASEQPKHTPDCSSLAWVSEKEPPFRCDCRLAAEDSDGR